MKKPNEINLGEITIFGKSVERSEVRKQKSLIYQNKDKLAVSLLVLLILLSESLIYFGEFKAALLMYAFMLTALSLISIFVKETEIHNICQLFLLLPIFRLINFSIPAFSQRPILSFIFIYAPMIPTILIVVDNKQLTYEQLGINFKNIWYYIPLSVLTGLILGLGEYSTVKITSPIQDLSFINVLTLTLVMILFVGVIEEIIFRSLIQVRLEKTFGMLYGLLLSSLLFGLMNAGYGNIYEILYTFFVGLLIGFIFQKTRSLPFIAMIHGFINVFFLGHGLGLF